MTNVNEHFTGDKHRFPNEYSFIQIIFAKKLFSIDERAFAVRIFCLIQRIGNETIVTAFWDDNASNQRHRSCLQLLIRNSFN